MSLDQTQNFVRATIASAVDSADTTIDVTDSNQLPDHADGEYNLILWDVSTFPRPGQDPAVEVVRATALDSGTDTLSVDRGQENTAAADHPETAVLQLSPTAKMCADIDSKTSALSADGQTFAGESVDVESTTIAGQRSRYHVDLLSRQVIDNEGTFSFNFTVDRPVPSDLLYFIEIRSFTDEDIVGRSISLEAGNPGDGDYNYLTRDQSGTFTEHTNQNDILLVESPGTLSNDGLSASFELRVQSGGLGVSGNGTSPRNWEHTVCVAGSTGLIGTEETVTIASTDQDSDDKVSARIAVWEAQPLGDV